MYKKKRSKKKKITASHRSPYRSPYRTRSPRLERCIRSVKSRQKASCASHKWKGQGCYNPWAVCYKSLSSKK